MKLDRDNPAPPKGGAAGTSVDLVWFGKAPAVKIRGCFFWFSFLFFLGELLVFFSLQIGRSSSCFANCLCVFEKYLRGLSMIGLPVWGLFGFFFLGF